MKNTDNDIIRATILVERNTWELFRELAKENESDASKEIRKFIKEYIAQNTDKIKNLMMKGDK